MVQFTPVEGNPFQEDARLPESARPAKQAAPTPIAGDASTLQFTPVEGDPFETAQALIPQASTTQAAVPQKGLNFVSVEGDPFGTTGIEPDSAEAVTSPEDNSAIIRGLVTSVGQQTPELLAETLEAVADLGPEFLAGSARNIAGSLRELAKRNPEEFRLLAPKLSEIEGFDDVLTFAGELFGQGVGSALLPIAGGITGGLIGGAVGGPVGAAIGGGTGAVSGSYLLAVGEVRSALIEAGVEQKRASELALEVGAPIAALDAIPVGGVLARLGGVGRVKTEVIRKLATRIAQEGLKVSGKEAITEMLQEVLNLATVSLETDKPFFDADNTEAIITAGIGGFLVGGAFGGVSGIKRDAPKVSKEEKELGERLQTLVGQPPSGEAIEATGKIIAEGGVDPGLVSEPVIQDVSEELTPISFIEQEPLNLEQVQATLSSLQQEQGITVEAQPSGSIAEAVVNIRALIRDREDQVRRPPSPEGFIRVDPNVHIEGRKQPIRDTSYINAVTFDKGTLLDATSSGVVDSSGSDSATFIAQAFEVIQEFAKELNIRSPIDILVSDDLRHPLTGRQVLGVANTFADSVSRKQVRHLIEINNLEARNVLSLFATLSHEFGHIIQNDAYERAPGHIKRGLLEAYEKDAGRLNLDSTFQDVINQRNSFLQSSSLLFASPEQVRQNKISIMGDLSPSQQRYFLGFNEWFAEQMAKWASTDVRALSTVDRFFKKLGDSIRTLHRVFMEKFGVFLGPDGSERPVQAVDDFIQFLRTQDPGPIISTAATALQKSAEDNQRAFAAEGVPNISVEPQAQAMLPIRNILKGVGLDRDPRAKALAASGDKINGFIKWTFGLTQLADANDHITPLLRLRELWQVMQLRRAGMMNRGLETTKAWEQLRRVAPEQSDAVAGLMDDYMNLDYLSAKERDEGVVRRPDHDEKGNKLDTNKELLALAKKNGVDEAGLTIFARVVGDFDFMLDRYAEQRRLDAQKQMDRALAQEPGSAQTAAVEQAKSTAESVEREIANFKRSPYMPAMRFGEFAVVVKNDRGEVTYAPTFETESEQLDARVKLEDNKSPGETITHFKIKKQAGPLMGLPPGLLDKMAEKLNLTPEQQNALSQLKFDFSPSKNFKNRFRRKNRVPGYSKDFQRAYVNYMFHGSNYFVRLEFVDQMREQIDAIRESAKEEGVNPNKRADIAEFAQNHFDYMMNPDQDYGLLRGVATGWILGFSPAAATLNLSQMFIGSIPFMSAAYGSIKTVAAMTKAGTNLTTYYRKADLANNTSDLDLLMLDKLVRDGTITEAMAPALAARTVEDNLKNSLGSTSLKTFHWVLDRSMKMFEMTEQANRRITARAAFRLALENPNVAYIKKAVEKHRLTYEGLLAANHPLVGPKEAAAIVAAKDTVEATQFIYQDYARPRFMRGGLKTLFLFKSFTTNTLIMFYNYPTVAIRSFLVMGFLGGMMGLPGAEDLKGILKGIGNKLFGRHFNLELEARKFVLEVLEKTSLEDNRHSIADVLIHGVSSGGYGIPAIMQQFGVPFPKTNRSAAIGLGGILPIDPNLLFGPQGDEDRALLQNVQRAGGAAFGTAFGMARALSGIVDGTFPGNDFKSWEKLMPRSLRAISKAYRGFSEGEERSNTGATVVKFDINDPEQMMELIAQAGGYQSTREAREWDRILAISEVRAFWNSERGGLLRQYDRARRGGDKGTVKRVLGAIKNYNSLLPKDVLLKRITSETLSRSFKARERARQAFENRTTVQRSDRGIARGFRELFARPEDIVSITRTR